jgi:hypothetical protein
VTTRGITFADELKSLIENRARPDGRRLLAEHLLAPESLQVPELSFEPGLLFQCRGAGISDEHGSGPVVPMNSWTYSPRLFQISIIIFVERLGCCGGTVHKGRPHWNRTSARAKLIRGVARRIE